MMQFAKSIESTQTAWTQEGLLQCVLAGRDVVPGGAKPWRTELPVGVGGKAVEATIKLFEAYAQSLGIDLTFQDFAAEMASMPGEPVGCVGLRPLAADGYCEVKRLYVDPKGRGTGVGKALAQRVLQEAKRLGYRAMRLDTLPHMECARALYKSLGFKDRAAAVLEAGPTF
ncbi:hypothetical protein LTR85_009269 [Meristemomyces frigidus]|nr:hypothetical protein LTR85_009269 [Meristemomyces frigidus]